MTDQSPTDLDAIAAASFAALGGHQRAPFSHSRPEFTLDEAYAVTAAVRRAREEAGAKVIGRKIGFTNRTIWEEYQVYAPMWGYMYDNTVTDLAGLPGGVTLTQFAEPRIEPEVVFHFATAPEAGLSEREILDCIDQVAHGFEIVQSIFPNWSFAPADTVAAYGLHGALFTGPWQDITADRDAWFAKLPAFEIDLLRNGELADHGQASNVLDGPLTALKHLIDLLAEDPNNPQIAAGEIVTTGTLTRAFPVVAGETWSTAPGDIPLEGISITFVE
ncbi:MAG: hypothetical protein QM692_23415 [Thermomicrobiales bacterium]